MPSFWAGVVESDRYIVFRFGVFEADLGTRELRKHGVRVKLQEQPFAILEAQREFQAVTGDGRRGL